MSLWNHHICDTCWFKQNPGRRPVRLTPEYTERIACCFCGKDNEDGIIVREDPANVKYCEHTS